MSKSTKILISGGGTGGHIFPAIAIANELKSKINDIEIQFVGAKGRMEMEKVPMAGYQIKGLWISGLQRRLTIKNLLFPFKLILSLLKAKSIIYKFRPNVVIGTGGYASGPLLFAASVKGIPTIIQEQNSYPGKTNILLSKKASLICTAYEGLSKFFPEDKIRFTGNPVRKDLSERNIDRQEAHQVFGLDPSHKTILILGGSLGAKTLNDAMMGMLNSKEQSNYQYIWQCGKYYFEPLSSMVSEEKHPNIKLLAFISRMDAAYAAADLIVSRAGALSVSELCLVGKPVILVPSPNVSEDHQTKNAMSLVNREAAVLVKDTDAQKDLILKAHELLVDEEQSATLSTNILRLARPNATSEIVDECESIIA